jgi:hypothetical protein
MKFSGIYIKKQETERANDAAVCVITITKAKKLHQETALSQEPS